MKVKRSFGATIGAAALAASAVIFLLSSTYAARQAQDSSENRALIDLVGSFAASENPTAWLSQHLDRLTPETIAALEEATRQATLDGAFGFVRASSWLLTFVKLRKGDRIAALRHRLKAHEAESKLATTVEAYEQARDGCLGAAKLASESKARDLAFRGLSLAADSSYFASSIEDLDRDARETWQRRVLEDLNAAALLASHAQGVDLERFASLIGAALGEALSQFGYGGDENWRIETLRQLAASLDRALPIEFAFEVFPGKQPWHSRVLAQQLADLGFLLGNPTVASNRLYVAAQGALAAGDIEQWSQIVFQRYQGVRDSGGGAAQLSSMRTQLRAAFADLRGQYVSRAGRLWAAGAADLVFAELLKDQLEAGGVQPAEVFEEVERLKSRYLLDQLTVSFEPLARKADSERAHRLERELLSFPDCRRVERSLGIREMLLTSRVPIGSLMDGGSNTEAVRQLEALYRRSGAGFKGTARIPALSEVQAALHPDEIILEYFIPFHPTHPAMTLWVLAIAKDRAVIEQVDLEGALGHVDLGFIGRMSIDNCPPLDASALGVAVFELRLAIQSSNESKALRLLRGFHALLIEPLIRSGLSLSEYKRMIVVPHGPLHYVPFAALRTPDDRFLISDLAVTVSPSTSVWLEKQRHARMRPRRILGLLAPKIEDPNLPLLPGAEREVGAIRRNFEPAQTKIFTGSDAVEARLRELGPQAEIIHLSTHGDFPEREAIDFHQILLASAEGDDGRLQAREIQSLDLRRTAVVLLAICNGGLYSIGPSDEPYGLIPAFFSAGASAVVGTLWPLEDKFGREFVARLYDALLEVGPSEALRKTAMSYIEEEELLRRWAGFIIVGSARGYY